jgi:type III secretion protein U
MSGEKTFDPTDHKIKKAREDGDVAVSQDLMKSAVCIVGLEVCGAIVSTYHDFATAYFRDFIDQLSNIQKFENFRADNIFLWIIGATLVSLCVGCTSVVVFIAMSWLQTAGPVIKKAPIEFKLDGLLPQNYFKKIFSMKTVVDISTNLIKALLLSITLWFGVVEVVKQMPAAVSAGIAEVSALMGREAMSAARTSLILLFILGVADFWLQRMMSRKKLKMSLQDIKDEHKQTDGNPESKNNIRSFANELLSQDDDGGSKLKGANVLVVNPTHVAVGLRYVHGARQLPNIRSSGIENEAKELIELARDTGVPVVRHIWLARTLYNVPAGAPIPREAYRAVAAVFRMILALETMKSSEADTSVAAAEPGPGA